MRPSRRALASVVWLAVATASIALAPLSIGGAGSSAAVAESARATSSVSAPLSPPSAAPTARSGVITKWLRVVDTRRWTVSHGHVLAHSRSMRVLVLEPPGAASHPLVVFCHGYDSTPDVYLHLLRRWAESGFVVAAPYFPLTRTGAGRWLDENDVANQPGDVSAVITAVTRRLGSLVGGGQVVVAGHSDGGSTAFAVGFERHVADRRVTALMVFSGDRWGPASQFRAPARRLPLLLVQSDRDESNSVHAAAELWSTARLPKIYLHLHGAPHLPPFARDCPWRPIVEAVTTDFLRAWTASRAGARARLLAALDRDGARTGLARVTDER